MCMKNYNQNKKSIMCKSFFVFVLFLVAVSNVFSAVPIVFYDTEKFPSVEVKFMLVDNANRAVLNLSQYDAGIDFYDNGVLLNLTSFNSSIAPSNKASVVIAFDLSISQRTGNIADFTFAKDITDKYISYLSSGETDISLISISNIPSIETDWTTSASSVAAAMNSFSQKSFGNLYKGITLANTGALSILEDVDTPNKSVLLVTQGIISLDETELIIAKAKQIGVRINILYVNNSVPTNIKKIADETGGYCINKEIMDKIGLPIFVAMAKLSEGYTPYILTANVNLNCDGEHIFRLNTNDYGFNEFITEIDSIRLTRIEAEPNSLEFASVNPNTTKTESATIYARNSGLTITEIYCDDAAFEITAGLPTFPHYLNKDDSLKLQITFSPEDSSISFTRLIIVSDACSYDTLFITGGYPNVPPRTPSIKIVKPRCGDVLVIGDTVEIEWNGVLPNDVVSIFSISADNSQDTIARNVIGLKRQYIVEDNGKEDSVKFIINQMWPNSIGKTLNFKHDAPVLTAFWNNYQDKIITTDNDFFVKIWNANTGDEIYTFPQFSRAVKWAVYAPNPNSVSDNYIGIACFDGYAYIYNTNNYSLYWRYEAGTDIVWSIEFSADCKYAVVALGNGNIDILDMERRQRLTRKHIGADDCRFATFHPEKQYEIMAISSYTGLIRFFDLEGNLIDEIDGRRGKFTINTEYVTYNQDGSKILFINYQDASADFIDRNTGDLIYSLSHNENGDGTNTYVNYASFFNRVGASGWYEDCILTSGTDGILRRWNIADGTPTVEDNEFKEHKGAVNTGILSKDGWRLLSSSDDSTAKIWNLNQRTLQADTTCMFRIAYARAGVANVLDLGSVFQGEIIVKYFESAFQNICDFNYNIRVIRIVGDHPTDFNIIDEFDFPMNISGLVRMDFNISFRPSAVGVRKARIQIVIPNDTLYIDLVGVGLNIGLQPLCDLIDFGNVYIDDYKDTLFPIAVNVSDTIINIENIDLTGPQKINYKFNTNNTGISLNPNDTLFADIRFFPLTIGKKNAVLNINHSYHSYPLSFNFTGRGVSITIDTVMLGINDLTAEIGQTINCPIILNTLTNNNIADVSEIIFSLVFNSSVIYPQSYSPEVKILNTELLENGNKIVDISIPYKPGRQQIDGLQFVALLGNDTTTNIQTINTKSYNTSRYYINENIAIFKLINNCNAGGTRLFDEKGKLFLQQNIPNPATEETKIEFEILENGLASLDIYDILGKHIMNIFSEEKQKGVYEIIINTKNLTAGMYYYILYNARQQQIQNMLVK